MLLLKIFALTLLHTTLAARQPNVVVILTDDQGWGDLSVSGNTNLATPHIDSLADQGITMENFYVCQVCAPTRAEFLTGRYYPRTGVSGVSRGQGRLNPDETTIADIFKNNGYATGAFGKWHNGTQAPYHPNDRGFDEYYGFTSGHWGHYFSPPLDHNRRKVRGHGYVVDDFTDHAIDFIKANRDQPFFCYIPYNTPHSPMMISDEFYGKFEYQELAQHYRDPDVEDVMMTRAALAMCENIDWNVGRVLSTLNKLQLSDDTIVVYFSDNGPNSYRWNGDMKGRKSSIEEGGLRSPFFIRWTNTLPAGKSVPQITGAIDLLPTLTQLASLTPNTAKPLDGRSFESLLSNSNPKWQPRSLFAIKGNQVSVRTQRYRLDAKGQLFNINTDRGQYTNVAKTHPAIVKELQAQARAHQKIMQAAFAQYADRPFTVGYAPTTTLPARDAEPHGTIQRSSKAPNNSFFTHWTKTSDSITWDIDVSDSANYEAIAYYTCAAGNEGVTLKLSMEKAGTTKTKVTEVFDPPLYDKSLERMAESHYFVKDFKPLALGKIKLSRGRGLLSLTAPNIPGQQAVDIHSIELNRIDP
ncbi:MAG: arylsulfatase [Opitutales bacterium]